MKKYYVIKNSKGEYWDSVNLWSADPTFYTQHGRDTVQLPLGGFWVFVLEM